MGADFDPVAFHEFILTTGPAPFDLIREQMEAWMENGGSLEQARRDTEKMNRRGENK